MQINVLYLGPAKSLAGVESVSLDLPEAMTVGGLRGVLVERFPALLPAMASIRLAVNEEFADDDRVLKAGDEVALIPPVSGGCDGDTVLVDLVTVPIDAAGVRSFVFGDPTLGGVVIFEGATRHESDAKHGELVRLEYEAYESMARRQLHALADQAVRRWAVGRLAIVHRLGQVPPGEASVMIAVACGHRAESFEACRWLIDTLKKDVPIWKKDVFENGHVRWVDPRKSEQAEPSG